MNDQDIQTQVPFVKKFNDDWWKAQHPAVQAIRNMPTEPMSVRGDVAMDLANSGILIDKNIVIWGETPFSIHLLRSEWGVPYLLGMMIQGPGFNGTLWVEPPFPSAPAGYLPTVLVDQNDEDGTLARLHALYPLPPEAPAAPATTAKMVGPHAYDKVYQRGPAAISTTVKDGEVVNQDGKTFKAHVSVGLMGWACYFELQ